MTEYHGKALVVLDGSPQTDLDPVTLAEAKLHLRVDATADDALITSLISTARHMVEELTGRKLLQQTVVFYLDDWPDEYYMTLPTAPLISVTSVVYTDEDDVAATLDATRYRVDTFSSVPRIVLKSGEDWPSPSAGLKEVNPIAVTMEVGYGTAAQVPEPLKLAIKMLVAHFYEHREETTPLTISQIPFGVAQLLNPYRQWENLL